jgi:hypothetical protein
MMGCNFGSLSAIREILIRYAESSLCRSEGRKLWLAQQSLELPITIDSISVENRAVIAVHLVIPLTVIFPPGQVISNDVIGGVLVRYWLVINSNRQVINTF